MRELRRLAWAAVVAGLTATPAFAQITGGGTGGTGGGTGGGAFGGGTGGTGGTGGAGGSNFGTQLNMMQAPPTISAPSTTTGNTNPAINASNFLRNTYGNVYYQGRSGAQLNQAPGGFGAALYGTTTGGTGAAGLTGGRGGAGGGAFGGGAGGAQDPGGVIVTLPRQIAYPAQVRFPVTPVSVPQLNADLTGMIARSSMISNPAGVQVLVDGGTVILRGNVKDDEEARFVEGMVRLTPGVREIKNELAFPRP